MFMESEDSGKSFPTHNKKTALGYQEKRAIRFAYCVLGWPAAKISFAMGRTQRAVFKMIYRHKMPQLKARIESDLISKAVRGMESDVEEVTALTTSALKRWLTGVLTNDAPLTPKDAKLISDIGANFHRILQLIKNKPTSINKTVKDMTDDMALQSMVDVLKKMKEDPMFDMDKFLAECGISKEELKAEGFDPDTDVFN